MMAIKRDPTDDSVLGSWSIDAAPAEVQQQPPMFADAGSDEVFETNLQGDEFFKNGVMMVFLMWQI